MLVVTSNWNCSDKTLVASHSKKQFDYFLKVVHRAALRASMRFDGRYQPIERLDLVFAGDTYDWLTSRKWLDDHRPWGMPRSAMPITEQVAALSLQSIRRDIVRLQKVIHDGLALPLADRHGRPSPTSFERVPVRVIMLAGDRDRLLSHPSIAAWVSSIGIAIGSQWSDGQREILHGDQLDPLAIVSSSKFESRAPSLAESLRIDFLTRFSADLIDSLSNHGNYFRSLAQKLVQSMVFREPLDAVAVMRAWIDHHSGSMAFAAACRDIWKRSIASWYSHAMRLRPSHEYAFDPTDTVASYLECAVNDPSSCSLPLSKAGALRIVYPNCREQPHTERCSVICGHPQYPCKTDLSTGLPAVFSLAENSSFSFPPFALQGHMNQAYEVVPRQFLHALRVPPSIALFEPGESSGMIATPLTEFPSEYFGAQPDCNDFLDRASALWAA
ncbi:MAG: hypothetical protein NTX02_09430 [Planctomycetia bacterium]|nr:hypothetical protein [Planctomycetia bacterium]